MNLNDQDLLFSIRMVEGNGACPFLTEIFLLSNKLLIKMQCIKMNSYFELIVYSFLVHLFSPKLLAHPMALLNFLPTLIWSCHRSTYYLRPKLSKIAKGFNLESFLLFLLA